MNVISKIKREFQAIVLAVDGHGLSPLTDEIHKMMLPIANKPMIFYNLQWLETSGITGKNKPSNGPENLSDSNAVKAIKNYEGRAKIEIVYTEEGTSTSDILLQVKDKIKTDFILVPSDIITDVPLHHILDIHRINDSWVTCSFTKESDKSANERRFVGIDKLNQKMLYYSPDRDFEEFINIRTSLLINNQTLYLHSELIDTEIYVFKRDALELLTPNIDIKEEFVPMLVKLQNNPKSEALKEVKLTLPFYGFMDSSRWPKMEPETRITCSVYTLAPNAQFIQSMNSVSAYLEANKLMIKKTDSNSDSLYGEGFKSGEKSTVRRSVIGDYCTIGSNVKIVNSVIMDYVVIEDFCHIENSIISSKVTLKEKTNLSGCEVGPRTVLEVKTVGKNETFSDQNK